VTKIPTLRNAAFWRQRTTLDGTDYLLDFAWSARSAAWFLSVYDADEIAIVESVKLISDRPLLYRVASDARCPPGALVAFDPTGLIKAADFDQLGTSVELWYVTGAEVAAAKAKARA
jgi:hypothetical protein